jgi:hypothetical protein
LNNALESAEKAALLRIGVRYIAIIRQPIESLTGKNEDCGLRAPGWVAQDD